MVWPWFCWKINIQAWKSIRGLGSGGFSIQFESFKSTSNGTPWGWSYFWLWPVFIFDNYWHKMEAAYIDLFSKGDLLMTFHDLLWLGMLTMFCRPGSDLCDTQMVKLSASWISTTERWWKNPVFYPFYLWKNGWVPGTWFTIDSKKIGALVFHQHLVNLRGGGLWEWYTGYVLILRKKHLKKCHNMPKLIF